MSTKFFKIFRSGNHKASSGDVFSYSDKDIRDMATYYPLAATRANLVLGHPLEDEKPLGTVLSLHEKSGGLFAEAEVSDLLTQIVRGNQCAGVSCAFFAKSDPKNPVPGAWSLKHVGFMVGGMKPSLKDLGELRFAESVGHGGGLGAEFRDGFMDLTGMGHEVSFAEAQRGITTYQRGRDALHEAAVRIATAHPEFCYLDVVRIFERRF